MLQPRYSRLSSSVKNSLVKQALPTGNWFGGSILLKIEPTQDLVFPVVRSSASFIDPIPSICSQPSSPLIIEVSKIVLLTFWFWCSIGADFCFNSMSAILGNQTPDV